MSHVHHVPGIGASKKNVARIAVAMALAYVAASHAQVSIPGQFGVSNGNAGYAIPIQIPPGAADVQPALSLAYSSDAGNGLLGVGWTLSGLSTITRCARSKAQDNVRGAVNYDLNDRYCLDGQRLIAIVGADGANNTEYRTERENFSKIISYAEAGATNGPGSFVVKTAAGMTMEYGKTADSRIEAQGKTAVSVWALNKVSDTKGNYYTVSYTEDSANGDWRPSSISYTGNTSAGVAPPMSIVFTYIARSDVLSTYRAQSKSSTQQRLSTISLPGGRFYRLSYGATEITGHSRISKVELCASASVCLPAIVPTYAPGEQFSLPTRFANPIAAAEVNGGVGSVEVGDWNDDGRADLMWFEQNTGDNRWFVSNGNGTFTKYTNPISATALNGGRGVVHPGDWNGDGRADFLWYDRVTGENRWFMGNGAMGFTQYSNLIAPSSINENIGDLFTGDWNGDGRIDVMWYDRATGYNRWFLSSGALGAAAPAFTTYMNPIPTGGINQGDGIYLGDWNGDGSTDLLWYNSTTGENRWFVNNGSMAFAQTSNPIATSDINGGGALQIGDWNSDGIYDLVWYNSAGSNRWYVGNGALGFTRYLDPIPVTSINGTGGAFQVGDWNGDGRVDLLWYQKETGVNRWFINNGAMGFTLRANPIQAADINSASGQMLFGDWNADGITDVLFYSRVEGMNRWFINQGSAGQEMTKIDQGLGVVTEIAYGALTEMQGSQYFRDFVPSYPKVSVAMPMRVVKQSTSINGVGGTNTTRYSYGNLLNELGDGRGLLGFQWVQSSDLTSGVTTRTYYRQDWPYLGLVEKSGRGTSSSNWSNLSLTVNTGFTCIATDNAVPAVSTPCSTAGAIKPKSRYFIYPHQVDTQAWDYTGTTAGNGVFIALPRTRTTQTLDNYGNVTMVKTETLNPNGSASGYSKTTTNVYAPVDPAVWHLGRLLRSTVTATSP